MVAEPVLVEEVILIRLQVVDLDPEYLQWLSGVAELLSGQIEHQIHGCLVPQNTLAY